ncbi:HAAS signaling domain-containing protein [Streptococcus parasuis]|uniref:DUF1700 domain-containing protein n=1 Tax=Streptococcus parasuis TaxID=1501662 RepID=UPI0028A0FA2A|nr:DUF1700 domain-containing protein [Streptococcus parasuis]
MTSTEYTAQLEEYLKKLPHKEFQEAITFFNEYFDEAGPEKETAIMEELGSPKEAASELITNILNRHIQVEDVQEVDDEPINYKPLYIVAGLVLALLLSVFFLIIEPLFGIAGIFITSIAGAFYLGKNFQEVRKAKKLSG